MQNISKICKNMQSHYHNPWLRSKAFALGPRATMKRRASPSCAAANESSAEQPAPKQRRALRLKAKSNAKSVASESSAEQPASKRCKISLRSRVACDQQQAAHVDVADCDQEQVAHVDVADCRDNPTAVSKAVHDAADMGCTVICISLSPYGDDAVYSKK